MKRTPVGGFTILINGLIDLCQSQERKSANVRQSGSIGTESAVQVDVDAGVRDGPEAFWLMQGANAYSVKM